MILVNLRLQSLLRTHGQVHLFTLSVTGPSKQPPQHASLVRNRRSGALLIILAQVTSDVMIISSIKSYLCGDLCVWQACCFYLSSLSHTDYFRWACDFQEQK